MNYEALNIRMDRLAQQIQQTHLDMLGKPSPQLHSADYQKLIAKAEGWDRQIHQLSKAIKSKYGLLQMQYDGRHRADWRQKQSRRSHMNNYRTLMGKLEALARMVADMCGDILREDTKLQALASALEDIQKSLTDSGQVVSSGGGGTQAVIKSPDPIAQFNAKEFAGHQAFPLVSFLIAFMALYLMMKESLSSD